MINSKIPIYIAILIAPIIWLSIFYKHQNQKEFTKECETQKHGTVFYEYDSFMLVCVRGEKIN